MHHAKNMVGELKASYSTSLWKRYFRVAKHNKPGRIKKAIIGAVMALELKVGVIAYA